MEDSDTKVTEFSIDVFRQTILDNLVQIGLVFGGLFIFGVAIHILSRHVFKSKRSLPVIEFIYETRALIFSLLSVIGLHIVSNRYLQLDRWDGFLNQTFITIYILILGFFLIRLINYATGFLKGRYDISVSDNYKARRVHTQIIVLRRILSFIVIMLILAAILLQFESIRNLGVSILASAGVAGIVLGFAAQKTLGNLIAGIQIAFSQPMRVEDAVVVEGEWGWIEEITLTYVVVRIWDLRRLILPISYFVEQPFQNWTRQSATIIGSVFLYLDYRAPVDAIRKKAREFCEQSEFWDQNVFNVQVTDATENSISVRVIATAKNSPSAWNLRCELREKLIDWLHKEYPESLPVMRAEIKDQETGPDPSQPKQKKPHHAP